MEALRVQGSPLHGRAGHAVVDSIIVGADLERLGMAVDGDDPTRTADELVGPSLPRPRPQRLAAPLQLRDRDRYEVLGEHGRGGLGTVSRAHDRELGRDVAIKELLSRGDVREIRFLREALITARLEHPGIVPIHEAGRWPDGTPFYVMKLVAGRPLKELIGERETVEARLELLHHVIAVADAVAYAHKRKIIHRDLKASNVIAGDFGETIVIDWGLAKDLSAADDLGGDEGAGRSTPLDDLTQAGNLLGTPMYMAPEQRRGEPVDQRADVFAIGAMLWELCSLRPLPVPEPPERARLLRRSRIDKDLAAIVTKALAPDPRDRYQDAGELAEDLKAFRSGARIAARRYSALGVIAHWARRHRALAATVASALALGVAGTIVFVTGLAAERDRADAALVRAEQANDQLVLQNAELLMPRDPTAAAAALAGYRGKDEVRRQMLRAEAEGRGVAEAELTPHSDTIWFLAGDADGAVFSLGEDRRIAVTRDGVTTTLADDGSPTAINDHAPAKGLLAYARAPSGIGVLDLKTRAITRIEAGKVTALALAPDGSRLAALDARGRLTVWALPPVTDWGVRRGAILLEQALSDGIYMMFADPSRLAVREKAAVRAISIGSREPPAIAPMPSLSSAHTRGDDVVAGEESGHITLLSRALVPASRRSVCHKRVNSVRLAARARLVAFTCQDGIAGVAHYDEQGTILDVDTFPTHATSFYAWPDELGARVVVKADSNVAYLYDTESRLVTRYEGHSGRVSCVAAPGPGFELVLVGDVNGAVRAWKAPPRDARVILRAPSAVYNSAFSPDGRLIVAGGTDRVVYRVSIADGHVTELRGHQDIVLRVRFSPDGRSFLSFSNDRTIRTWSPTREEPLRVFSDHNGLVGDAEYIEGGGRIASVGDDGKLLIWSPQGDTSSVLFTHPQRLPLLTLEALDRSGHIAVHDQVGNVWSISPQGGARQVRTADGSPITMLRASPDGSLLAIGTSAGAVAVYETSGYKTIYRTAMKAGIRQISFDPQNRDLLIAAEDGQVRAAALDPRRSIPWRDLSVGARDVAHGRDGEAIALVSGDGDTWFYSLHTDSWIYTRDHATSISSGRFSRDGTIFASTDRSGALVIRDVPRTFTRRIK
jgi:WD40 repeat protein